MMAAQREKNNQTLRFQADLCCHVMDLTGWISNQRESYETVALIVKA